MKRSHLITLCVLVLIIVVAIWGVRFLLQQQQRAGSDAAQLLATDNAPSFTTETGEQYEFAIANGTVQIVTVWATWVPNIAAHLAVIGDVVASFDEEIEAIAVNRDEQAPRIEAFFTRRERPTGVTFVQNPGDALYDQLEAYAMPETVIFNGAGEIVWRHRGIADKSKLEAALREQLDI